MDPTLNIDLALIGNVCHLHDIKFVIDGTQSVGFMPLNVQTIQCNALLAVSSNGHWDRSACR